MPSIALQFPSGRGTGRGGISRFAHDLARCAMEIVSAIVEAHEIASRYHALSRLSDVELRKRGLTRETIARFALLGRTR
jgi:hypothetical protein